MTIITDTDGLAAFCAALASQRLVCIDTEFMREKTYYPHLCLVQLAGEDGVARAVDPLAGGMDLGPLLSLLADRRVLKVLHAGRQDIEIFFQLSGCVPAPLFDTQLAAMVCGFGDAVAYDRLARKIAKVEIDKSSRFTDWSKRPLTQRQLAYALADVIHLPKIYRYLVARLKDRSEWLREELAALTDAETYRSAPEQAWQRIRTRSTNSRFLAVLREVAATRERFAQERDLPRSRVLRDEALLEIAAHEVTTPAGLERIRGLTKGLAGGALGNALIAAVKAGLAVSKDDQPRVEKPRTAPRGRAPVVELLKVLLKQRCEKEGVAHRLVASTTDLERLAAGDSEGVPAVEGWRRDLFGEDALRLMSGKLALQVVDGRVVLVEPELLAGGAAAG